MRVRVLLFAVVAEVAGVREVDLDIPQDAPVEAVGRMLGEQYAALRPYLPKVAYAVNQSYVAADSRLQEGDEVALIPPVSGG